MGVRRFDLEAGGERFAFRPETEETIAFWRGKYPADRQQSAVIPMLWLAQRDNGGWLSEPAMREVADRLDMPYIRVYEVATFYTMFQLKPVGQNHVQLCGTTPCMLRGANELKKVCEKKIGRKHAVTDDGRLSWEEVECLGACVNAPMVQINDYYYEDLTPESFGTILEKLANGVAVEPGTFVDRLNSAPQGGLTSLTDETLYDGSMAAPIASLPNAPEPAAEAAPETKGQPDAQPPTNVAREAKPAAEAEPEADLAAAVEGDKPDALHEVPAAGADNLKRIKGIGPKNEDQLNALGIYTFAQIAAWTPENVKWVEGYLSFPGRVGREDWIAQAKVLAEGGETEFAARVDRGEVESSEDDD